MAAKPEGAHAPNGERIDPEDEPDLNDMPLTHLVAWWFEMGPVSQGMNGPAPVPWSEIASWQDATGVSLSPWEGALIRKLSQAFISFHEKAQKGAPSPLLPPRSRAEVRDKVRGVFSQLRKRNRNQ